jgi:hypothetical protein
MTVHIWLNSWSKNGRFRAISSWTMSEVSIYEVVMTDSCDGLGVGYWEDQFRYLRVLAGLEILIVHTSLFVGS